MQRFRFSAGRGWYVWTLILSGIAGFVAIIVASPWLMKSVVSGSVHWHELSDVGQAYGGISAILSGLALCGIAGSLLLQWRQTRLAHIMTVREQHFELVKMAIDDPDLMFPAVPQLSVADGRRWMVLNLWVAHWAMLWDTGVLSRPALKSVFEGLFQDDAAVAWWAARGAQGWDADLSRRRKIFQAIADEAHTEARRLKPTQVGESDPGEQFDGG